MTTTTNPGNYVDFDEYVGLKLEKTRSTIRTTDLLTASAGVVAMFLGYLLVFVVLDQWVVRDGFGIGWRWALLSTLMISTIAWLVWKIGIPSFRTVNGLFAAQEIEKAEPGLKSNLLNLIDLRAAGRSVNPAILKALERRAAVRLQEVDVTHAVDHRPLVRTAYVLLAVIVLFCLYALLSPKKISNSIWRGLLPAAQVPLATRSEILSVKPGDVTIPAHTQSVEIQVDLGGEIPHQVWMLYTTADGKFNRQPVELRVEAEGQTRFKGQLIGENAQGLMQDVMYVIKAGDAESAQFKITVEQPPSAEIETVRIEFPPYMKLDPIEQSQNGQIDAWEGAKVVVNAKTNMAVRSGMIQFLDDPQVGPSGEELAMSVTSGGRQLQSAWTLALRNDGTFPKYYRIDCKTEDGRRDTAPTNHALTIRPDLPPEVALLQPERDFEAPANVTIPLLIQAGDPDFELGYLYLNMEKGGQKFPHEILSEGRQPKLLLKHDLVLSKLNAVAGDLIEIWIEAYDNKQPRPNTRNTPKIKIRVLEPVTKKAAEQQLADQKEQRDEKLAEAERATNPDAAEKSSQTDDESKDGKAENTANSDQADPNQEQNSNVNKSDDNQTGTSKRKPGDQDKQDSAANQQNGVGQSKETTKNDRDKRSDDPSKKENGPGESKPNKPLSSDGSQDDEAIKRLSEKLNKNANQPDTKSANLNDPQTSEQPDTSPPKKETDTQHEPPKSPGTQDKNKSKTESAVNENDNPPSKSEETKSDDMPTEGVDAPKPDQNPEGKNKTQDKTNAKPDESNADQKNVKPEPNATDNAKAEGSDQKPPPTPDPAKDEKRPGTNSDEQPGKSDDQQKSSDSNKTPSKTQSDKTSSDDLPTGLNEDSPKQKTSQNSDKSKQKPNETDPDSTPNGPGEQAPDTPDAKKKAADGTEKGPAKPDRDPNSKPKTAKNDDIKRDSNEKPETRPGDSPADNSQKHPKEKQPNRDPKSKTETHKQEAPSNDPSQKPEDKSDEMKEGKPGKTKTRSDNPPEKQKQDAGTDAQDADAQDQPDKKQDRSETPKSNDSKQKKDQKDKEDGSSDSDSGMDSKPVDKPGDKPGKTSNSDSKSSDDQQGPVEKGTNSDKKTGTTKPADKSAVKKQNDSNSKPDQPGGDNKGGDKKGGEKKSENNPSDSKPGSDQTNEAKGKEPGGEASKGKPSKSSAGSAKPGPSVGDSKGGGGEVTEGEGSTTEGGDTAPVEPGEEANLEYNRQATELILQKLKKELERGEVDPELLEQLGWNQQEMKQFADRMSKYLEESKRVEESPEARARQQQFEEMLKNLDLQKSGSQRSGEKEPKRDVLQIDSKRAPVPPAYRSAYEKFTRDMARQKAASGKKN